MHRTGHLGVALLVYAPILFVLLAAGYEDLALAGGAVMLALTPVPDYDQRIPLVSHRGPTHSLAFAVLVGAAVGAAAFVIAPGTAVARLALAALGFGIGTLSIVAHLLADVITPAGIRPFWPVSNRRYSLRLTTAANPIANYLLFLLGSVATAAAASAGTGVA